MQKMKKDSSFEVQFSVDDTFYAYGFSALLSERRITGEWLYELYQNGSSRCIFERDVTAEQQITTKLTLPAAERSALKPTLAIFPITIPLSS